MNAIIDKLKAKAMSCPHNATLEDSIAHLLDLQSSAISGEPSNVTWDVIRHDFNALEAEGLWKKSETDVKVLDELRSSMESTMTDDSAPAKPSAATRKEAHIIKDNL